MVDVHTIQRNQRLIGLVLFSLAASATVGQADMVDLTGAGSSGTINGAVFLQAQVAPAGSGKLDSFVRIGGDPDKDTSSKAVVEGYNTTARPLYYDENKSKTFTHDLQLSSVPIITLLPIPDVTPGGDYYEFILDINQRGAAPLLSLDMIQVFQRATAFSGPAWPRADLGTPIYDLDDPVGESTADNWIKLDYSLQAGSGKGDVFFYLPKSIFNPALPYVYLYSQFGAQGGELINNDGYEEWAVRKGGEPVVPLPEAVLLGVLGLSAAGWSLRRFA